MSRWIDADKMLEITTKYIASVFPNSYEFAKQDAELLVAIEEAEHKTIDIVRCKECKHGTYCEEAEMYICNANDQDLYEAEHFCSYGERKDMFKPNNCTDCECTDDCTECKEAEHGCKDEPQTDCTEALTLLWIHKFVTDDEFYRIDARLKQTEPQTDYPCNTCANKGDHDGECQNCVTDSAPIRWKTPSHYKPKQTDCPTSCPSKDICTKDIADCAWK